MMRVPSPSSESAQQGGPEAVAGRPQAAAAGVPRAERAATSRIAVELTHRPHDFDADPSFRPMAIPDAVQVAFASLPAALDAATAELAVELAPGDYAIPFSRGEPCRLEVPRGCHAEGTLRIAKVGGPGPIVNALEVRFSRPVVFHNILATLGEVRTLFKDHRLAQALETAGTSLPLSSLSALVGQLDFGKNVTAGALLKAALHASEAMLDTVGTIHLSAFRAKPARLPDGRYELRFRFDGDVVLSNRVRIPFRWVRLPRFILPTVSAGLDELIRGVPLASADLLTSRIPHEHLVRVALRMLDKFRVNVRAAATAPAADVTLQTFNRGSVHTSLEVPGKASIRAALDGAVENGRLTVDGRGVEIAVGSGSVGLDLHAEAAIGELADFVAGTAPQADGSVELGLSLSPQPEQQDSTARVALTIREGTKLGPILADVRVEHPLTNGATELAAMLDDVRLSGRCELLLDARRRAVEPGPMKLEVSARVTAEQGSRIELGAARLVPEEFSGTVRATASSSPGAPLKVDIESQAGFQLTGGQQIAPIPEASIADGRLGVDVAGKMSVKGGLTIGDRQGQPALDFQGAALALTLSRGAVTLDGLRVELPAGTGVSASVNRGYLGSSGLGELELGVAWDMQGQSAVLVGNGRQASLFVDELRHMMVTVGVSSSGRLSFAGGHPGLYDGDFLNALVNPLAHHQKWLDILDSDAAMERVLEAIGVLSKDVERHARDARAQFVRARGILEKEGVREPGDIIPRDKMARVFSLLLAGDDRLQERLTAIIKRVTDGEGLDRRAVEQMIEELYPDHGFAFELDRGLRWLDHVLSPGDPLPAPTAEEHAPLVEDPRFAPLLASLPSARAMAEAVAAPGPLDPAFAARIVRVAAWLDREQLDFLVRAGGDRWPAPHRARLAYVQEIKRRVDMIARGYGGIGYAPQGMAIGFFLADVLEADPRYAGAGLFSGPLGSGPIPCDGLLGPQDVAVLLQAGLANVTQSKTVQANQRMLFDYLQRRPPQFFIGVLAEMGLRSPRVLTNVLLSLLHQEQEQLRDPLDMPAVLTRLLGIELPRRDDYMAGGRWAKESYYQALMRTSEYILGEAEPYLACKQHLQAYRHPPVVHVRPAGIARLEQSARKAIASADTLGTECRFAPEPTGPIEEARAAYEEAFAACRAVLEKDRRAFHADWLKDFWRRNHEALVVRSVVRNYQEDVDRVRYWLHTRAKRDTVAGEQELLETVIGALYYFDEDRKLLAADPLVRLLIDPPPGRYDFSVVTGMGVVTDGARGRELETSFERLAKQRGVELIRADTGTAKPLEYNAEKVIEAIEKARTPYGLIGYSQGCSNVLLAESLLRGGTPARQRLLEGLRCRNFLFSAANGSAHGSCGNEKFLRAMVEGEQFLKYYQAIFSKSVIGGVQKGINAALDSPYLTVVLGSVDSLSHEGVVALARDGQFLDDVPSSTVRGAITEEIVPEALEFLSNVITQQVQGALHDTQVTLVSAVGHPNRVHGAAADALARCDIGSYAQACHHWSPLLHETSFITTERDRVRAIYDFPKDRHVFPWIEVNARFGNIQVIADTRPAEKPKARKTAPRRGRVAKSAE